MTSINAPVPSSPQGHVPAAADLAAPRAPSKSNQTVQDRLLAVAQTDAFIRGAAAFTGAFVVSAGYSMCGLENLPTIGPFKPQRMTEAMGARIGCTVYCSDNESSINQWWNQFTEEKEGAINRPRVSAKDAFWSLTFGTSLAYAGARMGCYVGCYLGAKC